MLEEILKKPEHHRNKIALGLSVSLTVLIFISFAFYRGFLSFGDKSAIVAGQKSSSQVAQVAVASPFQNSKKMLGDTFDEVGKQYQNFKESVSSVFVPFFTSIEVYDRQTP